MRIIKKNTYADASRACALLIASQMIVKPDSVLGLATGSTPIGTYENLVAMYEAGDIDFSTIKTANLDEYKGLSPENDQSYRYFMNDHLFSHVNIDMNNTNVPNGLEPDSKKACEDYEKIIEELGGVDLQLLGLGPNGHIGFNEPCDEFVKKTHCVDLTESTISANARFFTSMDEVPKQAYTMGIETIMRAKKIVLIATGANKAETVKKSFFGPVTPEVPASILQLHPDCTIVLDAEAAALI